MLASRTSEAIGRSPDRRTGVVREAPQGGLLSVLVSGGATERVGYLTSYEPVVGDVVMLVQQRSTWVCVGRFARDTESGIVPGTVLGGVLFATPATTTFSDGAEHLISGYEMTSTLPAGHLIEILCTYLVDNNTNDADLPFMRIRENNISGAVVWANYSMITNGHVSTLQTIQLWMRLASTATKTYVLTAQRLVGGGVTFNFYRHGVFAAFDHGRSPGIVTL